MRYPLIFPHGEEGWHSRIPLANINLNDNVNLHAHRRTHVNSDNVDDVQNALRHGRGGSTRVSQSNYYASKLQNHEGIFSPLLHASRLCQEFCIDAWVCVEANGPNFTRTHQADLCADCYNGL